MNPDRKRLEELRDLALRDLLDVDRQTARGELSPDDADELKGRYEREALAALDGLKSVTAAPPLDPQGKGRPRTGSVTSRRILYAAGIFLALLAAFQVQRNLLDRPPGGLVSGNEVLQSAPASRGDLSKVTDAQLEAVVAANPDVLEMRLALARRYLDKGRYDLAVVHYKKVLEKEPRNPEALTHLAWVLFRVGRPDEAATMVDTAIEIDPELADAWWVQASIRLYGLKDPEAALSSLDRLRGRTDLGPVVRRQVARLRANALQALEERQ